MKKKKSLKNINMLFNGRNHAIKFVEEYGSMILEAKGKATEGTEIKVLTSKQILQRLLVGLAQVKASNISKNSLNEIRQVVYSLYQSKEIPKKYITT